MPKKKKKATKKRSKKASNEDILKKLNSVEKNQKELLKFQQQIIAREKIIESEEQQLIDLEKEELKEEGLLGAQEAEELDDLRKIEELEKSIKKDVQISPLKKITQRDVIKGIIGAFVGIVGHFAFAKGVEIAAHYSFLRSTLLLITSFIIVILFLYFAGFRKVDDTFIFKILPIRALVIYFSAIITVVIVLLLYGKIDFTTEIHVIYNTVAAISVLAVLGAGTADLIGRVEE